MNKTFFCAIDPNLRPTYASKAFELLHENGKIVGLLFDEPFTNDKPPFGGCKAEYVEYFKPYFNIQLMERAYNSVTSRSGRELFFKIQKKNLLFSILILIDFLVLRFLLIIKSYLLLAFRF